MPANAKQLELMIEGVDSRGKCKWLDGEYLRREDNFAIDGYLGLEAWPRTGVSRVHIMYDPHKTTPAKIKTAKTEGVLRPDADWPRSRFRIIGFDPMTLPDTAELDEVFEVPEIDNLPTMPELPPELPVSVHRIWH